LAVRIARAHTGGTGIVVTRFAYHGTTAAIAEISPALGEGVVQGPHVEYVDAPDTYRDCARGFPGAVERAFSALQSRGIRPAALLVDSVFTSDGSFVNPPDFLAGALEACHASGALFIADEVQPGFGRSGQFWGFSRHGIVPDLVTLGKPMGNGHPIAAVVVKPELLRRFADSVRYFNTFGGNPVSIAAADAVLDVLENEDLPKNAARVGRILYDGACELAKRHDGIGDVRGEGLVFAIELVSDRASKSAHSELAAFVVNEMRARRILLSVSGPRKTILKIRPPLCFSAANAEQLLEALDSVLTLAQRKT
jgi:4-aminobutyrate aminotransferase-like enzyme